MTKQITVRLPDELVEYADEQVRTGQAASRAAVVSRALERDRRRIAADRDIAILREQGDDPELDAFVRAALARPMPPLD
jgi:Arc/MetJ-type ribon-helix-helix transcriptional regulator